MKVEELVRILAEKNGVSEVAIRRTVRKIALESKVPRSKVYNALYKEYKTAKSCTTPRLSILDQAKEENVCPYCYEPMKRGNVQVKCPKCEAIRCKKCMMTHMQSKGTFAVCEITGCGTRFGPFELDKQLPKTNIKALHPLMKNILWDEEKAKLPALASFISEHGFTKVRIHNPEYIRLGHIVRDTRVLRREIGKEAKCITTDLKDTKLKHLPLFDHYILGVLKGSRIVFTYYITEALKEIYKPYIKEPKTDVTLRKIVASIRKKYKELGVLLTSQREEFKNTPSVVYRDIKGEIHLRDTRRNESGDTHRASFVFPCSRMEGEKKCEGFLSTRWKCMMCGKKTCKDCHEPDEEEHVCNPNTVESAKYIIDSTRACPKCGARIQRTYGCNHMFCTGCKTNFNYATGEIVSNSHSTNPHYHEWLRDTGQTRESLPTANYQCDAENIILPPRHQLVTKCKSLDIPKEGIHTILCLHSLVDPHGGACSVRWAQGENVRNISYELEKYLAGLTTEERMKDLAFKNHRKEERNYHNQAIKDTCMVVGRDILTNVLAVTKKDEMLELIESVWKLRDHINSSFRDTSRVLGYATTCYITKYLMFFEKERLATSKYEPTALAKEKVDDWLDPSQDLLEHKKRDFKYEYEPQLQPIRWFDPRTVRPQPVRVVPPQSILTAEDFVTEDEWGRMD